MPQHTLSPEILAAALQGLEAQREKISSQIAEIRRIVGGSREPATESATPRGKRKVSAAARKKMAEAQRRRWAKVRAQAEGPKKAARKPAATKKAAVKGRRKRVAKAPQQSATVEVTAQ
jgi:hypothetical protein